MKINLGCGTQKLDGYVNVDGNAAVSPDVCCDVFGALPFDTGSADRIFAAHVIEHCPRDRFFAVVDEWWRVLRHGGELEIYSPHYTSQYGLGSPAHHLAFSIDAFSYCYPEDRSTMERYGNARFELVREELLFFGHDVKRMPILSLLSFRLLSHGPLWWRRLVERFNPFGWDEYHIVLRAVKG